MGDGRAERFAEVDYILLSKIIQQVEWHRGPSEYVPALESEQPRLQCSVALRRPRLELRAFVEYQRIVASEELGLRGPRDTVDIEQMDGCLLVCDPRFLRTVEDGEGQAGELVPFPNLRRPNDLSHFHRGYDQHTGPTSSPQVLDDCEHDGSLACARVSEQS